MDVYFILTYDLILYLARFLCCTAENIQANKILIKTNLNKSHFFPLNAALKTYKKMAF